MLLLLAVCAQIKIAELKRSWHQQEAAAPLRARVTQAAVIPWRRLAGIGPRETRCDLWVSALGMAQVQCGAEVVYRGFGVVDGAGDFHGLTGDSGAPRLRALEEAPDLFSGEEWEREPLPPDETANRAAIAATFRGRQSELDECAGDAAGNLAAHRLRIDSSGKVLSARVEQSSLPPARGRSAAWRRRFAAGAFTGSRSGTPVSALHRLHW